MLDFLVTARRKRVAKKTRRCREGAQGHRARRAASQKRRAARDDRQQEGAEQRRGQEKQGEETEK